MWIKICGNTNLEDALSAAEAGANALGFVFAPSPRRVTADQVRKIVKKLPAQVEKYGVFVDAGLDEIAATVLHSGLTGVQIHRTTDTLLPARLRQHFAPGKLDIVLALNYKDQTFKQQLTGLSQTAGLADAVLVDSSTARAVGGTGTRFDWAGAQESFLRFAPHLKLIAAGGLTPDNVRQAIEILHPAGVDVVTGVESTPGKKDPGRVRAFIQATQQAAEELTLGIKK